MAIISRRLQDEAEDLKKFLISQPSLQNLKETLIDRISEALSVEAIALLVTAPVTFLASDATVRGFDYQGAQLFFSNIYIQREIQSFLDMKNTNQNISLLSEYTEGKLEKEPRYREVYRPAGFEHEIRVCLNAGTSYWGALCIVRGYDNQDFLASEKNFLKQIAPIAAEAYRIATLTHSLSSDPLELHSTILIDKHNRIYFWSKGSSMLFEEFNLEGKIGDPLPPLFQSVVSYSKQITIPDRRGRWWTVQALPPEKDSTPEISAVLVITPARPEDRFPRLMALYGISPKEQEIVKRITMGLSTKEIASQLFITPYTVQDHLKMIFEKIGVKSRGELIARIFHRFTALGQMFNPDKE